MEPTIFEEKPEQAFLVALDTGEYDVDASLAELEELAHTAGAQVLGALVQKRESPDKATCLGSGRLEELTQLCRNVEADLVIFDLELTATQHRNLESELPCRVVDRTALILDIFAARALRLPDGRQVLLIDTVGFVRRLPHHLVEAFRSTLEEAVEADVILNVCDASSPEAEEHLQVTRELLQELGCGDVPILTVFNKCDLSPEPVRAEGPSVCISAKTGQGLPRLLEEVAAALPPDRKKVTLLLPFRQGALAEQCRREGAVEREEYVAEGLSMTVTLGVRMLDAVKDYIV